MDRDPICPRQLGRKGGMDGIGLIRPASLPDRGDVVDVHVQSHPYS